MSNIEAKIAIPSSSANVGLFYDVGCLGLKEPHLNVTYTQLPAGSNISTDTDSPTVPPASRNLGYAGKKALEHFLNQKGIKEGAHLFFKDDGYPVGGLGRSGAEAVGAIMAAAVIYEKRLTRNEVIIFSAQGEPGQHKDNVAGSTNGKFNIVAVSPITGEPSVDVFDVPSDLGIAIGFSSHQKTTGTEGMKKVLQDPVANDVFVLQGGRIAAATAAMVKGDIDRLLEIIGGDGFHEPRRADIGGYGNFNAAEFFALKKVLFRNLHVALNVSGAGPNMQILFNKKEYPNGIVTAISPTIVPWFDEKGVRLTVKDMEIAQGGAYDYAVEKYGYKGKV